MLASKAWTAESGGLAVVFRMLVFVGHRQEVGWRAAASRRVVDGLDVIEVDEFGRTTADRLGFVRPGSFLSVLQNDSIAALS